MLRIGEFSRVSRVPVKTLRYYDEIGVFRPRATDDASRTPSRVILRTLSKAVVAATVHHGPYDQLSDAYKTLIAWISANGYRIVGPSRQLYLSDFSAPGNPVSEIQCPAEK